MSDGRSDAVATTQEARVMRLIESVMRLATDALGADATTVTVRRGRDASTVFAADHRFLAVDEVQYATGEGPCLAVLDVPEPLAIEDLRSVGERWPAVAEAARTVGAASTLAMPVPVPRRRGDPLAACVNYYTEARRAWSDEDLAAGARFATQIGDVLASDEAYRDAARLAERLALAMQTRAVIEQAKGVIMAATGADGEEAFQILKDESQHTNVKLREVARAIVERARRRDDGTRGASAAETERPADQTP
jgi:GAF domain-containing protein